MLISPDSPAAVNPFNSFWMAGFECADHLNAFGHRVDLLGASKHRDLLDADYRRLEAFSFGTAREGICWSHVETAPYEYDWSGVRPVIDAARARGVQVIWDLCHFGYPDDLTPLHPMFARRFAALCRAFVKFFRSCDATSTLVVTPINEVSFLSWLGGEARGTSPFCVGQGWEVKYRLMKAYIEGVEALREEDSGVRILLTEPLVNIVPRVGATPEEQAEAARFHEYQFQVADMLTGRMCPELRGRPEYLDVIGCNYYYTNQWEHHPFNILSWSAKPLDPRWVPLSVLLARIHARYGRPLILSETSHPKEDRPLWLHNLADESVLALQAGIPLWGICWYPIVDRPDWDRLEDWHHAGLWDRSGSEGRGADRELCAPLAAELELAQGRLSRLIDTRQTATVRTQEAGGEAQSAGTAKRRRSGRVLVNV